MESTEVMRAMCMIDLGHRYERSGDGDDAEHDGADGRGGANSGEHERALKSTRTRTNNTGRFLTSLGCSRGASRWRIGGGTGDRRRR
jgi:hypothetical protein